MSICIHIIFSVTMSVSKEQESSSEMDRDNNVQRSEGWGRVSNDWKVSDYSAYF